MTVAPNFLPQAPHPTPAPNPLHPHQVGVRYAAYHTCCTALEVRGGEAEQPQSMGIFHVQAFAHGDGKPPRPTPLEAVPRGQQQAVRCIMKTGGLPLVTLVPMIIVYMPMRRGCSRRRRLCEGSTHVRVASSDTLY